MWTVVYVSQSIEMSERLIGVLYENGVTAKLRRACAETAGKGCYEVLVPGTEMADAQDLIIENGLL